jgi:hypothetical protein
MATSLLAPGPLVQQGCTLQMDSQECTIQCPNCQPIKCPINQQGLYVFPPPNTPRPTAYNAIDVDEYIKWHNLARFAAAATSLTGTTVAKHKEALTMPSEHSSTAAAQAIVTGMRWALANQFAALTKADADESASDFSEHEQKSTANIARDDDEAPDCLEQQPIGCNLSSHQHVARPSKSLHFWNHSQPTERRDQQRIWSTPPHHWYRNNSHAA